MKKLLFLAATLLITLVACQKEEGPAVGDLQQFEVIIPQSELTRADGDGEQVNRCILQVYQDGQPYGDKYYVKITNRSATFNLSLIKSQTYEFILWADYVANPDTESGLKADYNYNTSDLEAITLNSTATYKANDETFDAFYAHEENITVTGTFTKEIELTRPFGQLTVETKDIDKIYREAHKPNYVTVSFNSVYTSFNAKSGVASGSGPISYTADVANAATGDLTVDYFFAPADGSTLLDFSVAFYNTDPSAGSPTPITTNDDFKNIPLRRNYKTIVTGNLVTKSGEVLVNVVPGFDETVINGKLLVKSAEQFTTAIAGGTSVILDGNITIGENLSIQSQTNPVTIDLNNNTLTSTSSDPAIRVENATVTLTNGTIEANSIANNGIAVSVRNGANLNIEGVTVTTNASAVGIGESITNAKISIKDSKLLAPSGNFALSTNATQPESSNIEVTVENTILDASSGAILWNIPGKLTVTDCQISGGWEGALIRGGDATFTNCTITQTSIGSQYNTWYINSNWGNGNNAPSAPLVAGNRTDNGTYRYPTKLTLVNTIVQTAGEYKDYFPSLYVYANPEEGNGVTIIYDEQCQFNRPIVVGSSNVIINPWDGATLTAVTPNESTGEYEIIAASELAWVAEAVNSGETFEGKTIKLNSDLDLTSQTWVPIGNGSRKETEGHFKGTFDGNGYTVKNLNATETRDNYGVGLFSVVNGGTVKNVTIEGGNIQAFDYAAAVVGITLGESTIENCHAVGVNIQSDDVAAGIVGRAYGTKTTIKNCTTSSAITTGGKAGGIIGIASNGGNVEVQNCTNSGTIISGNSGTGGIIGYAGPATNKITSCTNTGNIGNGTDLYVGGIVGYQTADAGLEITSCKNESAISGVNAGGIYGINGSTGTVTISDCDNIGTVTGTSQAGGIAAGIAAGSITSSNNSGNVTAATTDNGVAGGIAGTLSQASIVNCKGGTADAAITAQYAGRLIGHVVNGPSSPDNVPNAALTIDDTNGDDYTSLPTIATMALYTAWANINVVGGTLHGHPLVNGSAPARVKIHEGASWDEYPGETGTWHCFADSGNTWEKE